MDIVDRLRTIASGLITLLQAHDLAEPLDDAACEIERLRLEVALMSPAYKAACRAGVAGPEAEWVCQLCWGKGPTGQATMDSAKRCSAAAHDAADPAWSRTKICPNGQPSAQETRSRRSRRTSTAREPPCRSGELMVD